jgi:hypothetical protein
MLASRGSTVHTGTAVNGHDSAAEVSANIATQETKEM